MVVFKMTFSTLKVDLLFNANWSILKG